MAWRLVGIGWYIPLCLISGTLIGMKLDEWLDTSPWLALAGVTAGLMVALLGLYVMIRPLLNEEEQEESEKN